MLDREKKEDKVDKRLARRVAEIGVKTTSPHSCHLPMAAAAGVA